MGVGEPANMRFAIEHGIDMFDCVLPTRNGRHGTVWITGDKKLNLKNLGHSTDKGRLIKTVIATPANRGTAGLILRHLFKMNDPLAGKLASIHNLDISKESAKAIEASRFRLEIQVIGSPYRQIFWLDFYGVHLNL
jgi:queuine tRNA-ribosyltransferase